MFFEDVNERAATANEQRNKKKIACVLWDQFENDKDDCCFYQDGDESQFIATC